MISTFPSIHLNVRDPATQADPVALVTRHLDCGAAVSIHDSCEAFPRFSLVRRVGSVVILDQDGCSLATYADVSAAMRHGLTRWPPQLAAARDAAIRSAIHAA